jgi:hypothetical protein
MQQVEEKTLDVHHPDSILKAFSPIKSRPGQIAILHERIWEPKKPVLSTKRTTRHLG